MTFLRSAESDPDMRSLAGYLFEQKAHDILQSRECEELEATALLSQRNLRSKLKAPLNLLYLELAAREFLPAPIPMDFSLRKNVYYRPQARTQETFDSFALLEDKLVFFQMTFNKDHGIKAGGITKVLTHLIGSGQRQSFADIYFVFVVPESVAIGFPRQKYKTQNNKNLVKVPKESIGSDIQQCKSVISEAMLRGLRREPSSGS